MAAEFVDKLSRFQTHLLADEHAAALKTIPKDAIESIIESFGDELSMRVIFVCEIFVGEARYNIAKGEWEVGSPFPIFRRDGETLIGVKALQNGQLALVYASGRMTIVDPANPNKPRKFDYIGSSAYSPNFDPTGASDPDRPDFYVMIDMGPDRIALLDNILRYNYLEANLRTDIVDVYDIGGQYEHYERHEDEEYHRFADSAYEFHDVGFGRCLLVADATDDPPHPRAYILLDLQTGLLRTLPAPYADVELEYYDYCTGMADGSIFMVGGGVYDENRYVRTARCSKFDLSTGIWTRLADAPVPINQSMLVGLPSGDIMVVTMSEVGDKMLIYHPPTNTWKMTDSRFPRVRNESLLVVV